MNRVHPPTEENLATEARTGVREPRDLRLTIHTAPADLESTGSENVAVVDVAREGHTVVHNQFKALERLERRAGNRVLLKVDEVILPHPVVHRGVDRENPEVTLAVAGRLHGVEEVLRREVRHTSNETRAARVEREVPGRVGVITRGGRVVVGENTGENRQGRSLKPARLVVTDEGGNRRHGVATRQELRKLARRVLLGTGETNRDLVVGADD